MVVLPSVISCRSTPIKDRMAILSASLKNQYIRLTIRARPDPAGGKLLEFDDGAQDVRVSHFSVVPGPYEQVSGK